MKPIETSSAQKPAAKKHRVFLVDDHPMTRSGLALFINQQPNLVVCGEADNAPAAFDGIVKMVPDFAIIDISLKTTSGIELLKNLATVVNVPVLVMSMHDESLYAERALRAGARGYIMKQEASDTLLAAIKQILAGDLYLSDRMKEKMLQRLVNNNKRDEMVFSMDSLSDREMEVFVLLGNGFSTRQIAAKLNLSVKTIDSYREHLKLKLHLEKGTDLVRHAIQWVKSEAVA